VSHCERREAISIFLAQARRLRYWLSLFIE